MSGTSLKNYETTWYKQLHGQRYDKYSQLLYFEFSVDRNFFCCGTTQGFRVFNCSNSSDVKEVAMRDLDTEVAGYGVGIVSMLMRTQVIALVPLKTEMNNQLILYDIQQNATLLDITYKSSILNVKLLREVMIVVFERLVIVYDYTFQVLGKYPTYDNPRGLCQVSVVSVPNSAPGSSIITNNSPREQHNDDRSEYSHTDVNSAPANNLKYCVLVVPFNERGQVLVEHLELPPTYQNDASVLSRQQTSNNNDNNNNSAAGYQNIYPSLHGTAATSPAARNNPNSLTSISNIIDTGYFHHHHHQQQTISPSPKQSQPQPPIGLSPPAKSFSSKKLRALKVSEGDIACMALSHDGSKLATASEKGTLIRVWDLDKLTKIREFRRGTVGATIYSLSFSRDSNFLCCSSNSGTIHVFALNLPPDSSGAISDEYRRRNKQRDTEAAQQQRHENRRSSFKWLGSYMNIFNSEWSFAEYNGKECDCPCICTFDLGGSSSSDNDGDAVLSDSRSKNNNSNNNSNSNNTSLLIKVITAEGNYLRLYFNPYQDTTTVGTVSTTTEAAESATAPTPTTDASSSSSSSSASVTNKIIRKKVTSFLGAFQSRIL